MIRTAMPAAFGVLLAAVAAAQPAVVLEPVVSGFTAPVDLLQTPIENDDRLFVVEQNGAVRIVDGTTVLAAPFLDVSAIVSRNASERGLLGMAFHPSYGSGSDHFFIDYTNASGSTVIARYARSAGDANVADPSSARILLTITQDYNNHNGGQVRFGPDGYLYIGMGDGGSGNDPNCNAQNTGTLLGKLLRLDVDQNLNTAPYHGIPASNPFVGIAGRDEIWAYGLRNPWRFSFDRQEGDLWIADVGQGTREEIDWQPASSAGGENYGWKVREGTSCTGQTGGCSGAGVTLPSCASPPLTDPVHEYLTHVNGTCAVIGGFVYRGSEIPALAGKYVFGDFCSKDVWAYDRQSDALTPLLVAPANLFTFGERRDGELLLGAGGAVYLLARDPAAVENWAVF